MELKRIGLGMILVAVVVSSACEPEAPVGRLGATVKGGDDRSGPYDVVPGWWKPASDHDSTWTWGSAAGVWPDTPDRVMVVMWGDQRRQPQSAEENERNRNFLVALGVAKVAKRMPFSMA